MRKQVATLFTVVLLASLSFTANAAIKPGSTCKKLGVISISSGKKYTCVKLGKKLVWNKGVVLNTPNPSPFPINSTITPTPTPTVSTSPNPSSTPFPAPTSVSPPSIIVPWQADVLTVDLIYSAMHKFNEWQSISRGSPLPSNYVFDDSLPTPIQQELRLMYVTSQQIMGDFGVKQFTVLAGTSEIWMNTQLKTRGIGARNPAWPDGMKIEYCNSDILSNIGCTDGRSTSLLLYRFPDNYYKWTERNGPIHEYFHLVFSGLSRELNFSYSKEYPGWFFEGAPSYFANAILEKMGLTEFRIPRKALLDVGNYSKFPRLPLKEYYQNDFPTKYIYGIGEVAVEYIAASSGVESVLNIYRNLGNGDTFEVAFKKSTGITLDDFYRNFDKIQNSVGIYT